MFSRIKCRRLTRGAIFGLFFVLVGCGRAPHIDPPVYTYDTKEQAELSAREVAKITGGVVFLLAPTGSMAPLLVGDEFVSVDKSFPIDHALGRLVAYWPEWNAEYKGNRVPVVHRAVARDKYGLLMEGDAVPQGYSENKYRVTQQNYIGVIDGIFRVK